jgi:hypothetical protein
VIPREPPASIVPRPPPPDWSLESAPPRARRPDSVEPWPTSLLTLPSPVYQPLGQPARAKSDRPRRRRALGWTSALLALTSVALACWQLYWLLESSEGGRALLARAGDLVASVAHHF